MLPNTEVSLATMDSASETGILRKRSIDAVKQSIWDSGAMREGGQAAFQCYSSISWTVKKVEWSFLVRETVAVGQVPSDLSAKSVAAEEASTSLGLRLGGRIRRQGQNFVNAVCQSPRRLGGVQEASSSAR